MPSDCNLQAAPLQACIKAQSTTAVLASVQEGIVLGISATPTLFVNGERVDGAVPMTELQAMINRALRDAGQPIPMAALVTPPQPDAAPKAGAPATAPPPANAAPAATPRRPRSATGPQVDVVSEENLIRTLSGLRTTGPAVLVVLLALLVSLAGCNRGQTAADVMAKVNGRKILRSEVDKYYSNQTAASPQQPTDEQSTSLKLGILKELIDNEILMQRAEKLGLLATNEEVDQKLNEIKAPYTQEEFDKRLKERKISLDDFKRDLRRSITIDKVLNHEITSKIAISDNDISGYYNAHKAEFNLIEPQYHLAHIFVTHAAQPAGAQPEGRQGAERGRGAQEDPDDHQPARQRRGLCHRRHELFRGPGERRQWRRPRIHPAIGAGQDRSGHARRRQQAQAGPVQQRDHHRQPGQPAGLRLPHR